MGFMRGGGCVGTLVYLLLSLLAVRSTGTVVLIGKNVSLSFDDIEANFSPAIKSSGISGVLYVAEPLDACSPLTNNVEEATTSFALIIRGGCTFDDKVMAAQKAGFKAAIVYDNEDGGPLVAMAGSPEGIRIHAIFISKASGEMLKYYAGRSDVDLWIIPTFENSAWSIMAISFISLLAMSAVLATCFFVRRHRIRRERPRAPNVREFHGMSKHLVKAMPSIIFTSALEDNCTSRTCAICLEDYNVGEQIRILPCRHKFHAQCVDSWLTTWRTFCPVCKRDARTSSGDPPASESTPLLTPPPLSSSPAAAAAFSSFRSSPSPSPSRAIQIAHRSPAHSPSRSSFSSIPRHPYSQRPLCNSPSAAVAGAAAALTMNRSSADLRNVPSHRSLASLLSSPQSSFWVSPNVRGSSIGSPSYLAGSFSQRQSFLRDGSSASLSALASAHSLPDC
ncbi:unnamed protein product [Spirodela intermedia]|uniref:RING-type domain-containing protein n=1 Tax=Spirodela intermedia TaxID=51605 RepID=A0A7I8L647_SPIIN|nr:unnamed protein product [Spirodela intermedia]